ncbi:MAG: hypothetical protein EBT61_12060 [Verrucomicrobia bacterium]|nr:hypothetical protein [Verrucomicrobiota bacterium]
MERWRAMGKLMPVMMLVSRFRLMVMAEVLAVVDAAVEVFTHDDDEQDQRFSPRAEAVADRRIKVGG